MIPNEVCPDPQRAKQRFRCETKIPLRRGDHVKQAVSQHWRARRRHNISSLMDFEIRSSRFQAFPLSIVLMEDNPFTRVMECGCWWAWGPRK